MKPSPPRWVTRFLEWYCHPKRLEEIEGDAFELFARRAQSNKRKARFLFVWDVIRFFRWKNIRKPETNFTDHPHPISMLNNLLVVARRNFMRHPGHSFLNLLGLTAGLTCGILIYVWVAQEFSFDRFTGTDEKIFRVLSHMKADAGIQTFDIASGSIDVSTVPEVKAMAVVSTGTRWPHELCFRPEASAKECVYLKGVYASEQFFRVFDIPAIAGNGIQAIKPNQIAISEKMALNIFHATDVIGKPLKVDGRHEVTVISVFKDLPAASSLQLDFVMPMNILQKEWGASDQQMSGNFFSIYLKTSSTVNAELLTLKLNDNQVLTKTLADQKISYQAFPLIEWHLNSKFENGKNTGGRIEYVRLFIAIAILLVLMAVINFVNMTTSRASTRAKEIGIRKVTGALRSGIVVQFLSEAFIIVLIAFMLAIVCSQLALPWFNSFLPEPVTLSLFSKEIFTWLFLFLIVISFLAGVYPALVLSSFQPITVLKDRTVGTTTGSNRLRKILLLAQISISLSIIMFSGVLFWQLNYIGKKDLGMDRLNMIHIEPTYKLLQQIDGFKNELMKSGLITGITAASANPLNVNGRQTEVVWPGKAPNARQMFSIIGCTYEFPETFGLKILDGRNFAPRIQDSTYTEILLTPEAVKTMQLPNPVGERITIAGTECVVIGVVNDFYTGPLREERLPVILQRVPILYTAGLYVKYKPGSTQESLAELQRVYSQFAPDYPMKFDFQDDTFAAMYKTENTASRLVMIFTIVTLIIAIIGIVGLATFNVFRKSREIGVRRVFGATRMQILFLLTHEFAIVIAGAAAIAVPLTWYFSKDWLSGFAYHIGMPWWWFAMSFAVLAITAIGIIWIQALRTVKMNPTESLRAE